MFITKFNLFNFALLLLAIFISLTIEVPFDLGASFSDMYDYLYQSKMPLTDLDFFIPSKKDGFYPRPFTIPLVYKLCGSDRYTIILVQRIVHFVSAFFLIYSLSLFIKKPFLKYLFAISLYFFMFWWNVLEWTILLLSESLSFSFLLCWLASLLLFIYKKDTKTFILHLIIAFLFSFTRDTWPYILVAFYALCALVFFIWEKELFKRTTALLVFSCLLFFIQKYTSEFGNRHRLPVINSVVMRIIPNQDYFQWFVKEGMPCSDSLKKNFSAINYYDESRIKVYDLYKDSSYNELHHWMNNKGKTVYTKFLLTHPSYFFLMEEKPEDLQRIFCYNLYYAGASKGLSVDADHVFPIITWWLLLILLAILLFLFIRTKKTILLLPSTLTIVFAGNVLLSYNADAFEVERHLFITNVMIHVIGLIALSLITDIVIQTVSKKHLT